MQYKEDVLATFVSDDGRIESIYAPGIEGKILNVAMMKMGSNNKGILSKKNNRLKYVIMNDGSFSIFDETEKEWVVDEKTDASYALIVMLSTEVEDNLIFVSDKNTSRTPFEKPRDPRNGEIIQSIEKSSAQQAYYVLSDFLCDVYGEPMILAPYFRG